MATKINVTATANMAKRKAILEAKREQLLGACRDREEILIDTLADPADRMTSHTDRDVAVQRLDHESRLIHDIEQALDKLETNAYGICEMCETPISSKRLDALPWARLCFACQSEAEAAERFPSPELEHAA
jgi:DnaK suppressor protein